MKTRTEYQTEKKRLKVPKVEEFTISFTDGVSERLKVRISTFKPCSVLNYLIGLSCRNNYYNNECLLGILSSHL